MDKQLLSYTGYFDGWPKVIKEWVIGDGGMAVFLVTILSLWYTITGRRLKDQKEYKQSEQKAVRDALLRDIQKIIGPCKTPGEENGDEMKCMAKIVSIGETVYNETKEHHILSIQNSTDEETIKSWQDYVVPFELGQFHWRALQKFDTMFYPEQLKSKSAQGWYDLNGIKITYLFRIGIDKKRGRNLYLYINMVNREYILTTKDHYRIVGVIKEIQQTYKPTGWFSWLKKKLITQ